MKLLVVDNYDSFTYMLVDYLHQAGADCHIVRNNEPLYHLTTRSYDAVVLSPGPGTPKRAGRLMEVIEHYHQRVPILGVCLGHQALGEFFGATLIKAAQPMHGKVSTIHANTDDVLFKGLPKQLNVTRYHSLLLHNLPDTVTSIAVTNIDQVMAIKHKTLPVWGVQFHPEAALTMYGSAMLKNWINFVNYSTVGVEKQMLAIAAS